MMWLLQLEPSLLTAFLSTLIWGIGIFFLLWKKDQLQGTTLIAPWYWVIISWSILALVEISLGISEHFHHDISPKQLRFLAALTTFCPQMAQLGAKRPQDNAWQWIVLSLWAVLAMPVGEAWFSGRGGNFMISGARSWFLVTLILVGLLNNGPTRFAPTSILTAFAQALLLSEFLPALTQSYATAGILLAQLMLLLAIFFVVIGWPAKKEVQRPLDRVWLDFRDSFGAFWAARVAQRMNDSANRYQWGLWLSWTGFNQLELVGIEAELMHEINKGVRQSFRSLLRRFVDKAWIEQRMPPESEEESES